MRITNPLNFVPDNVKYFDGFSAITLEAGFMTLDEKIKKDPMNREKFRCESKISSGGGSTRRRRRGSYAPQDMPQTSNAPGAVAPNPAFGDGPKEFIKNMTPNELILDFHPNPNLKKGEMPQKPKVIKHFMAKYTIQGYLDHPILRGYYDSGLITDVTKEQRDHDMALIQQRDLLDAQELEGRKQRAAQVRADNPHSQGDLRRLTADGVEIITDDASSMASTGGPSQAVAADGGMINFGGSLPLDVRDGGPSPAPDVSTQENLVNQIIQNPITDE